MRSSFPWGWKGGPGEIPCLWLCWYLLCDFPDSVSVIKIGVMIITKAAEFFDIGIRKHMYQEFVIGVSAGILRLNFVMSTIGISFRILTPNSDWAGDAPSYRISVLDSKSASILHLRRRSTVSLHRRFGTVRKKSNLLSM